MATASGVYTVDDIAHMVKTDMGLSSTDYTSAQYKTLTEKSLIRINRKLNLSGTNILWASGTGISAIITPNPNDNLLDLILLQNECLIAKNKRRQAISKGIRVRDGDSSIDTTASFSGHDETVKDYCGELDKAIADYLRLNAGAGNYGEMVWYGNRNVIEGLDHNGDDYNDRDWTSPFDC